jgi:hypothetical protein
MENKEKKAIIKSNPLKTRRYIFRGTSDREGVEDFARQVLAVTL